jgi:hypothetical protein
MDIKNGKANVISEAYLSIVVYAKVEIKELQKC